MMKSNFEILKTITQMKNRTRLEATVLNLECTAINALVVRSPSCLRKYYELLDNRVFS